MSGRWPHIDKTDLDLNDNGGRQYSDGTIRASAFVALSWQSDRSEEKEKYGIRTRWKTYYVSVIYHSDGRLEFKSAVGDEEKLPPQSWTPTGEKSTFLTPEEWADQNTVARMLEDAYRSPFIKLEESFESYDHDESP